jgi:hypothetical protein
MTKLKGSPRRERISEQRQRSASRPLSVRLAYWRAMVHEIFGFFPISFGQRGGNMGCALPRAPDIVKSRPAALKTPAKSATSAIVCTIRSGADTTRGTCCCSETRTQIDGRKSKTPLRPTPCRVDRRNVHRLWPGYPERHFAVRARTWAVDGLYRTALITRPGARVARTLGRRRDHRTRINPQKAASRCLAASRCQTLFFVYDLTAVRRPS